jgi:hypothetical protein
LANDVHCKKVKKKVLKKSYQVGRRLYSKNTGSNANLRKKSKKKEEKKEIQLSSTQRFLDFSDVLQISASYFNRHYCYK